MSTRKKSTIWHKILLSLTVFSFCIQAFVMLAKHWWIFDLFSHYIAYYAILGSILLILQLCSKRFIMALFLTPIVVIQFATLAPYITGPENIHTLQNTEELSILASNVYLYTPSFEDLEQIIMEENPDIFVIHEASTLWEEEIMKYEEIYPYTYRNKPGVKGMVIGSKVEGEFNEIYLGGVPALEFIATDNEGQYIYRVIAVHPPAPIHASYAAERDAHLLSLAEYLNGTLPAGAVISELPTVIIGDFNITPWSPHFQNLLNTTNYKDAREGFGLQNTWHAHWPFPSIPIDHAVLSPDIEVIDFYTTEKIQSDHLPIVVEIEI